MTDANIREFTLPDGTKLRRDIDPDLRWFWTTEWQAKEREADEDLCLGRYEEFENMDDFIDSLP